MTAALLVALVPVFVCGLVAGRYGRSVASYRDGVRAGRISEANARGEAPADMRRMVRRWDLANRQRAAVPPFVTRDDAAPVARTL